jgi:hypothetical protein
MNKKQIREAVAKAIEYADREDAKPSNPYVGDDYARRWSRLSSFVISLQTNLAQHAPEISDAISEFQQRVIYRKNPLLDGDSASEGGA